MALLGDLAAALAAGDVRVVDLTQPLSERTPVLQLPEPFANTPVLSRRTLSRYDDAGPAWAWDVLELGEHTGTHFDAPIHWVTGRDGEDVASVPPSRLIGPAVVLDFSAQAAENPDFLLGAGKYGLTQLANLASLPPVGALVVVAPLKLVDGTGSPTRALALV